MKEVRDKRYETKVRDTLCYGKIDLCSFDHIHDIIIGIIRLKRVLWLDKSCKLLRSVDSAEAVGCLSLAAQTAKGEAIVEGQAPVD